MLEMALTQLVINIRYALMSVSLSQKLDRSVKTFQRMLIAYGNTDEIFAVASSKPGSVGSRYMYGLIFLPVIGWVGGTLAGAVASTLLPAAVISALGVALYGMSAVEHILRDIRGFMERDCQEILLSKWRRRSIFRRMAEAVLKIFTIWM